MVTVDKVLEFEWDKWNQDKSYQKHGITIREAEEVFLDENLKVQKDIKHSETEKRFIAFGKASDKSKVLFIVFTMRKKKIRIISVRAANRKERSKYEA